MRGAHAEIDEFRDALDDNVAYVVKYSKGGVGWDEAENADGHKLRRMVKAFERLVIREMKASEAAKDAAKK